MASSISDNLWLLRLRSVPRRCISEVLIPTRRELRIRASGGGDGKTGVDWIGRSRVAVDRTATRLCEAVAGVPPVVFEIKRSVGSNLVISLSIAFSILVIAVRKLIMAKHSHTRNGSVADLVRRGQLRSDRGGISKPLKYDDPFNNPLMKMHKSDSTLEMFGKVYRVAPVTLTDEQQSSHKMRRSRVYKWKRPTMFLKEGAEIPPDVDPDTIRWIPANHPFATTVSDIDENTAQTNIYLTNGVPSRIRAEHEALQRKLEALQTEQKPNIPSTPNISRDVDDEKPDPSDYIDQKSSQSDRKSCSEPHSSDVTQ